MHGLQYFFGPENLSLHQITHSNGTLELDWATSPPLSVESYFTMHCHRVWLASSRDVCDTRV